MRLIFISVIVVLLAASCSPTKKLSRNYVYFQTGLDSMGKTQFSEPIIQNNDLLSIQVFSGGISQEQASVFNIPNGSTGATSNSISGNGSSSGAVNLSSGSGGYQVGGDGEVEMPIIGKVRATGFTKSELEKEIAHKLDSLGLVKAPFVLVKFNLFKINVLGEVKAPGAKTFTTDRASIIDALALSGDLTDDGRRDNIMVIREEKDGRHAYNIDLRSGAMFQSPVFQLQQNDVVYVAPRQLKLRNLSFNPTAQRNIAFVISIVSLLTSIAGFTLLYNNRSN